MRGSRVESDTLSPEASRSKFNYRLFFWRLILVLGLLQVWAHRNEMCADGISYIEIAWATTRDGLHQIVNADWSPLCPLLLSLVVRLVHPAVRGAFTAAHVLSLAVYGTCLGSFSLFLTE